MCLLPLLDFASERSDLDRFYFLRLSEAISIRFFSRATGECSEAKRNGYDPGARARAKKDPLRGRKGLG